ncbi:unnamed protein product, partial [Brassica oleracea]
DRKRLAYLAIFTGYIEGRKYSTPTRVLMDSVKGRDISGCYTINGFAQALQVWTRVINFVQKDIGDMFPKWEFDVEDTPAENIIKLMFVKKPWKWTMDCWEVTAKKKVVKEDSPRPRKKARKETSEEASEEAAAVASEEAAAVASEEAAAEASEEEIKYLSERVEAVEKKVGITAKRKGTSAQNTTPPPKPTLEPGVSNESSPNKRLTRQSLKNKN